MVETNELNQQGLPSNLEWDVIRIHGEIEDAANRIAKYKGEHFYKETGDTYYNGLTGFKKELPHIQHAIDLASQLRKAHQREIIKLPPIVLYNLVKYSVSLNECLRAMRNFYEEYSSQKYNSHRHDETKINQIERKKESLLTEFYKSYEDFKRISDSIVSIVSMAEINALKEQVNKVTDAQTKEGIEQHHDLFEINAKSHYWAAWFWFIIGTVLAIGTWCFGLSMVDKIDKLGSSEITMVHDIYLGLILARVFLFGFLVTLIYWAFKNYRLNKHNELLNKQKALSIQTFTKFSEAAGTDTDMRRAVLGKITSTIFDTPNMGYIKSEITSDKDGDIFNTLANLISKKES